jgi:polysaccharide chain length determinant protein (PEP-CTERM system associated)
VFSGRPLTLGDYWLMVRRRKWLWLVPFLTIPFGTALVAFSLPDIYRADAVILVETPKVSASYVQTTVASPVEERVRTIAEQIKTRERLEKVIRDLNLMEERESVDAYVEFDAVDDRQNSPAIDAYINKMRHNIQVEIPKTNPYRRGEGGEVFSVLYAGEDPYTVARVVTKLASVFIEENLKVREQQASATREFLSQELQRVNVLVQEQEKVISEFKQQHKEELPERQGANRQVLNQLQQQLQDHRKQLENVRDRKQLLMQRLANPQSAVLPGVATPSQNPDATRLEQQLAQLAELQQIYTDTHPEIKRLKRQVAELQRQLTATELESRLAEPSTGEPGQPARATRGSWRWQLQEEIEEINLQELQLERQQANMQLQIAAYEQTIARGPQIERELGDLTRDYENTQKNYQSLLAQEMQAEIAENLEKQRKAGQFKVLRPARVPTKPWQPDRRKLLMMGLALGLAVGGGLVFLVEYVDHSFRDPEDFKQYTGLPVLAAIPQLTTPTEQRKQRLKSGLVYSACALVSAATLAGVHLWWMKLDLLLVRTLQLLQP